jgi:hypothetical protein
MRHHAPIELPSATKQQHSLSDRGTHAAACAAGRCCRYREQAGVLEARAQAAAAATASGGHQDDLDSEV